MKLLEDGEEPLQSSPHASAFIIDALSLLQTLTRVPDRFVDLPDLVSGVKYSHRASGRLATRIYFVAYQNPDISIKNVEHQKQGRTGS